MGAVIMRRAGRETRTTHGSRKPHAASLAKAQPESSRSGRRSRTSLAFPIVGVGASAGGLEAFSQVLEGLPDKVNMALVLVQHLDPFYKSMLAEILARKTKIPVVEAADGTRVLPNHVYVIPPNKMLTISKKILHLDPRPPSGEKYSPIDNFLVSLADDQKERAVGVVLSGTAQDGIWGLRTVKEQGGITIAQEASTAVHSELPRSAANAGVVDLILAPGQIAKELDRLSQHPFIPVVSKLVKEEDVLPQGSLEIIFDLLKNRTGVDFRLYKQTTIRRRILKRMAVLRMDKMEEYAQDIRTNPAEVDTLYQELLVSVTGFFREPKTFQAIESSILPLLLKNRARGETIRVWAPGCSTGEEAFSIAMTLAEYLDSHHLNNPVQIFATDVNDRVLQKAREGVYRDVHGVPLRLLRRYFHRVDASYQVNKQIRGTVVFAKQNVVADPPFSKMDLIICRNLLIYLTPVLQKKLLPILHYSLKPGGFLVLGDFESIDGFSNLFKSVDKKRKIYLKKEMPAILAPILLEPGMSSMGPEHKQTNKSQTSPEADVSREVDRILLGKYSPSSVIVNDDMEVIQFRGRTGFFLEPAPGKPNLNVLNMVREGLMGPLRAAIHHAKGTDKVFRREGIRMRQNGAYATVNIEVTPLKTSHAMLVTFEEGESAVGPLRNLREPPVPKGQKSLRELRSSHLQLQQELASTKEYLQSIIEDKEASNEELKAANEEIQSSNEELQSTNEELETAKEELQATNEELNTINEELQHRNVELVRVNDDLLNLLGNINSPVIMMGNDLRIRRVNPQAERMFRLQSSDIGQPIANIRLGLEISDLAGLLSGVLADMAPKDMEVSDNKGKWYLLSARPYRTADNKIDGVVMTLYDIDKTKRTEQTYKAKYEEYAQIAEEQAAKLSEATRLSAIGETAGMVGHDLRNPLQTILNTVHLAKEKLTADDKHPVYGSVDFERLLENIRDQATNMNRVVSDLQDYAKILKPSLTEVKLDSLIGETLESLRVPKNVKVSRKITETLAVKADQHMLRRVLINLLTNALDAMPSGGGLTIQAERNEKAALIRVIDTGEGIRKEALTKVFSPFYSTKSNGTGLGLAVAKRLTEAQGGSITVSSEQGKGSIFSVEIPLAL